MAVKPSGKLSLSSSVPMRSNSRSLAKLEGGADRVIGESTPRLDAAYLRGLDSLISIVSSLLADK